MVCKRTPAPEPARDSALAAMCDVIVVIAGGLASAGERCPATGDAAASPSSPGPGPEIGRRTVLMEMAGSEPGHDAEGPLS